MLSNFYIRMLVGLILFFGTFVKNVFMTNLVFTMKDFVCSGLQFSAVILIKSDGLSIKKQADGNVNKWIYYEVC